MLQKFISDWTGKKVPSRGGITGQCVSLSQQWAQVNGVGGTPVFPVPAAKLMVGSRPDAFVWVKNTITGVPPVGAIPVWNGNVGGGYGHTGVVVSANVFTMDVFQQNDPVGSGAHVKRYNYKNVEGWLILKSQATPVQQANQGATDMITSADRDPLRVISSEVKGWDFDEVHKGTWDARELAAWVGRPWHEYIMQGWHESPAFREARNRKMRDYDLLVRQLADSKTKAEYEAVAAQAKVSAARVAELEKEVEAERAKASEDTKALDTASGALQSLINFVLSLVKRNKEQ